MNIRSASALPAPKTALARVGGAGSGASRGPDGVGRRSAPKTASGRFAMQSSPSSPVWLLASQPLPDARLRARRGAMRRSDRHGECWCRRPGGRMLEEEQAPRLLVPQLGTGRRWKVEGGSSSSKRDPARIAPEPRLGTASMPVGGCRGLAPRPANGRFYGRTVFGCHRASCCLLSPCENLVDTSGMLQHVLVDRVVLSCRVRFRSPWESVASAIALAACESRPGEVRRSGSGAGPSRHARIHRAGLRHPAPKKTRRSRSSSDHRSPARRAVTDRAAPPRPTELREIAKEVRVGSDGSTDWSAASGVYTVDRDGVRPRRRPRETMLSLWLPQLAAAAERRKRPSLCAAKSTRRKYRRLMQGMGFKRCGRNRYFATFRVLVDARCGVLDCCHRKVAPSMRLAAVKRAGFLVPIVIDCRCAGPSAPPGQRPASVSFLGGRSFMTKAHGLKLPSRPEAVRRHRRMRKSLETLTIQGMDLRRRRARAGVL